jgi:hypothetical protein
MRLAPTVPSLENVSPVNLEGAFSSNVSPNRTICLHLLSGWIGCGVEVSQSRDRDHRASFRSARHDSRLSETRKGKETEQASQEEAPRNFAYVFRDSPKFQLFFSVRGSMASHIPNDPDFHQKHLHDISECAWRGRLVFRTANSCFFPVSSTCVALRAEEGGKRAEIRAEEWQRKGQRNGGRDGAGKWQSVWRPNE